MEEKDFKDFMGKKRKWFSCALILLLTMAIFWLGADILNKIKEGKYIGRGIETQNTISVSGKGEVYTKPDLVLVTFSVVNEAKKVSEAMKENTQKMNAVIDFLKKEEIEDKDLKTTAFQIYPRYEYYEKSDIYPQGKRVLVGYEIQQSLQVKIRDIEKTGQIIEGATTAGANEVGSLQFTVDNQDELKKQAREAAIKEAKDKAKELAQQLGVKLVRIINFSESEITPRYYDLEMFSAKGGGETPQIETGESKIEVTISIIYEIN